MASGAGDEVEADEWAMPAAVQAATVAAPDTDKVEFRPDPDYSQVDDEAEAAGRFELGLELALYEARASRAGHRPKAPPALCIREILPNSVAAARRSPAGMERRRQIACRDQCGWILRS